MALGAFVGPVSPYRRPEQSQQSENVEETRPIAKIGTVQHNSRVDEQTREEKANHFSEVHAREYQRN